ncbi:hypothetical protein BH09ACT6_BH09ACT6_11890 [soil metagenome]
MAATSGLVVFLVSGCAAGGADAARPEVSIVTGAARLDPANVAVDLPLSHFMLDVTGQRKEMRAQDLVMQDCMGEKGYPTVVPNRLLFEPVGFEFNHFGPWVAERAAKYGYGKPPKPPGALKLSEWDQSLSQSAGEIAGECIASDAYQRLDPQVEFAKDPAARGTHESYQWAKQDPIWAAKVVEFQSCMRTFGYQFVADHQFMPSNVLEVKGQQEIEMAMHDVECKTQVNLVQELSDLVAAYQNDFISKNEAALLEQQNREADQLKAAEAIIAAHAAP